MPIVPTNYTNKPTAVSADSVWGYDSEGVANVNFTMAVILAYIFNNSSTSDLSEGTNLYYTDARVSANATVTAKADKTNVLELDNTTAFTPTADYHPATKKYIDDLGANINGLTEESAIANGDELIFYDSTAAANRKIDYEDLSDSIENDVGTSIVFNIGVIASDTEVNTANTEQTLLSGDGLSKVKEFKINNYRKGGTIRAKIEAYEDRTLGGSGSDIRFYINGSQVGSSQTVTTSYVEYTADLSVSDGDLVQIYGLAQTSTILYLRNAKLCFDEVDYSVRTSVILD